MINIILCGGNGTRLWPLSRKLFPKQFNKFDKHSLFQQTVLRNKKYCNGRLIISNEEHYFLAMDQLSEIDVNDSSFLLEPVGRNTAPAIALACLNFPEDEIVLVTPSDHLIKDLNEYDNALRQAKEIAEIGNLVTFGITPSYPETGYGYIEAEGINVVTFKEKPDEALAQQYLDKGNYYWNSGMFMFKVSTFIHELTKHSPELLEECKQAVRKQQNINNAPIRIDLESMLRLPDISVDYAVMEKSDNVKVIPSDMGWSDLGSFDALYNELPKDTFGNSIVDQNVSLDSHNNLIISDRMVATIDIDDLIVIDTEDALLISKKGSSQKVKEVVKKLKDFNSNLDEVHVTAYRPWGSYTVLEESDRYKIKKINVKPGGRLSLQKHFHRNEHWVVVSGTAKVTVGEEEKVVRTNESIYIDMGEVHRLENPGKINLVLIEVQVGEYLGEDDIIRIEDDFNRK